MPIHAPIKGDAKRQRELPKATTHKAVCIGVWDLGYWDDEYKGEKKVIRKIRTQWELNQRMEGEGDYKGKRFVIGTYPTSLSFGEKANLTKMVNSILGKELTEDERKAFDLESLKGMSALISIAHKEGRDGLTYANISGFVPLLDDMEPLAMETNWSTPPEWLQKEINQGWTIQESDSDSCKLAKAELLVAKEEAEEKAKKSTVATSATTSEAEAIGADSTAELIAECDAEQAIAQAETEIPFGSPAEDVSSLSEPEMILKIRKLCMELKIEVQKHITATLGNPITTDKLTKEQAEQVLLELIKIKQSQESFAEESEGE